MVSKGLLLCSVLTTIAQAEPMIETQDDELHIIAEEVLLKSSTSQVSLFALNGSLSEALDAIQQINQSVVDLPTALTLDNVSEAINAALFDCSTSSEVSNSLNDFYTKTDADAQISQQIASFWTTTNSTLSQDLNRRLSDLTSTAPLQQPSLLLLSQPCPNRTQMSPSLLLPVPVLLKLKVSCAWRKGQYKSATTTLGLTCPAAMARKSQHMFHVVISKRVTPMLSTAGTPSAATLKIVESTVTW
eukprot:m.95684 g.95684  ORF g.95684 m.95684 type:complete len:245 (+) comp15026_c0_seq2:196-930(+)